MPDRVAQTGRGILQATKEQGGIYSIFSMSLQYLRVCDFESGLRGENRLRQLVAPATLDSNLTAPARVETLYDCSKTLVNGS